MEREVIVRVEKNGEVEVRLVEYPVEKSAPFAESALGDLLTRLKEAQDVLINDKPFGSIPKSYIEDWLEYVRTGNPVGLAYPHPKVKRE